MSVDVDQYKVDVPEGEVGAHRIERFTVSPADAKWDAFDAAIHGHARFVPPGTYTRLVRGRAFGGKTIMSDTPNEIRDLRHVLREARGHVLIAGLGLGVVLQAVGRNPKVTQVTLVEKSSDVVELTWTRHFAKLEPIASKTQIVQADILRWTPPVGEKYDVAWFDIWDDICADNLPQMATLHRKFCRRVTGWYGSWCKTHCEIQRDRDKARFGG